MKSKHANQPKTWVMILIIVSSVVAAAGLIFGAVKAIQAIMTGNRYRALEKALQEEDFDSDAVLLSVTEAEEILDEPEISDEEADDLD